MVKNGKHINGKQRWKCKNCNISRIKNNSFNTKLKELEMFTEWILNKNTVSKSSNFCRRTFENKTRWCWEIDPLINDTQGYEDVLFVDATHIKRLATCNIVISDKEPKAHIWTKNESSWGYEELLRKVIKPKAIVTDGGSIRAIKAVWREDVIIQRCLFHIKQYAIQKLSRKPKDIAGLELLDIVYMLLHLESTIDIKIWKELYDNWNKKYNSYLKEKSFNNNIGESKHQRKWWYKHKNLRSVRKHLNNALVNDQLFQHIYHDYIPKTNNKIEGGINSRIKELRRCHRGLSLDKMMRVFEWYLWSRSKNKNLKDFVKKST
jgi:hypothetical protein